MPNRLASEKSPYLLQHSENPVEWYPWGEEAFETASREQRPIFLSIGYATCHWCHVMERESFEDPEVAAMLNRHFIAIKVDREERPDVDQIYMSVCQALTGSGGWPLSIFMTPEKKPFFAGSYFPARGRMGMPGFMDIMEQLSGMWNGDRERMLRAGDEITRVMQPKGPAEGVSLDLGTLETAHAQLSRSFDPERGGFGNAPKFPTPHHLTFLLRWHRRHPESNALKMVEKTLDAMRSGGIYDHVGYGFHRYSVDAGWLAPHFEKMLYDQALLAMAYTEAHAATRNPLYAATAHEIFTYVLRDMTDPDGGFYSAEDADTQGVEGLFYTWTPEEVTRVLGEAGGDLFSRFYDVTAAGNFEEGRSIPHLTRSFEAMAATLGMEPDALRARVVEGRGRLFSARRNRPKPLRDDKILTSWNGLMIAALARGYQVLHDPYYAQTAARAARFILKTMVVDGRLHRRHRAGETAVLAYADDYAFLIWGLLDLYEATFDVRHLEAALDLQRRMIDLFWDGDGGGFFFTGHDAEKLIVREKEIYDGAVPSSNSVAALNLIRLARMTGETEFETMAGKLFACFSSLVRDFPSAYTQFLNALDFALGPSRQFFIAGDPKAPATRVMLEAVQEAFIPNRVVMLLKDGAEREKMNRLAPFLSELHAMNGGPTAFVCENFACRKPVGDLEGLRPYLDS